MKNFQCFIWISLLSILSANIAEADILLISNKSVDQTSFSKDEVQMIFLGKKKKWENGKKIYITVLAEGKTHETFLDEYVQKKSSKFSSYWKMMTVSGTGYPPKKFSTEADLVAFVAEKEGAIGYISSDTPHEGVNVISIK